LVPDLLGRSEPAANCPVRSLVRLVGGEANGGGDHAAGA
jgi:hypothetical protein